MRLVYVYTCTFFKAITIEFLNANVVYIGI